MSSVPPPVWPAPEPAPETPAPAAQPTRSTSTARGAATGTLIAVGVCGVVLGAVLGVAGDRAMQTASALNGSLPALLARSLPSSTTPAHPPPGLAANTTGQFSQQLRDVTQDLIDNKISAIKLEKVEWGPIVINGNKATATSFETWSTTFPTGSTDTSRERNTYTLTQQDGAWKV